jgi:dTDP-4-dehydrorhamnose 3,5-epimerase-like enzyme
MKSHIVKCPIFSDTRGDLVVFQDQVPFEIKRSYVIHGKKNISRGGHAHKITFQALSCLQGSMSVSIYNKKTKKDILIPLDSNKDLLILFPEDWHKLIFHSDAIVIVFASEIYDEEDYIYDKC